METPLGALASHGVLGIVAALAIAFAVWAVRAMREEMHFRIAATEGFAGRMELSADKDRAAQMEFAKAIASLAEAQRFSTAAIERNTSATTELTRNLELREALRKRSGDSGAAIPAVRGRDPRSERG